MPFDSQIVISILPQLILASLTAIITAAISVFFSRRKTTAEIEAIRTSTRKTDAEIGRMIDEKLDNLIDDLEVRVKNQADTIVEQDKRIEEQGKKIVEQSRQYSLLLAYVEKLEDILIDKKVIKRHELLDIRNALGVGI